MDGADRALYIAGNQVASSPPEWVKPYVPWAWPVFFLAEKTLLADGTPEAGTSK